MDLRTQISLIAGVLALAVVATVLLRSGRKPVHLQFSFFGASVGFWHLTTFAGRFSGSDVWIRVNLLCAVLLPLAGVRFFRVFLAEQDRRMTILHRITLGLAVSMMAAALSPLHAHIAFLSALFIYVIGVLVAALSVLFLRGRQAASRFEGARLRFMVLVGALATVFTSADYLPYVGVDIPPVGTVLTLVFLYMLSQSVLRYRLIDLYELAGRLTVITLLAVCLAVIFWVLVEIAGARFFLHSIVASLVLLLLFDPLRSKTEDKIAQLLFRERYGLEQSAAEMRRDLARALERDDLSRVLMMGLEASRRVTHAAVYLVDEEGKGYDCCGYVGPEPAPRIEAVPIRPMLRRLAEDGSVILETVEREVSEHREAERHREAETTYEVVQILEAMNASVCVAIEGEKEILGLLAVRDERLRDAYSHEEIATLRGVAGQAAIAFENTRHYQRMKERDRLAALGEMAAGLAHEIRNPLGAIKASAQYLTEPADVGEGATTREFLDIIVEEVDRLNHVVSSFLDYARPSRGNPTPTDVNATVERTMQLLAPSCQESKVRWNVRLADGATKVRIDAEQLRQVLINLSLNAIQAMPSGGELLFATERAERDDARGARRAWVDIHVSDTGTGIDQRVRENLFVPFVTTKDRGTGLGLAISQRIVTAAGGRIDVRSYSGAGTTFVVSLPSAEGDSEPGPTKGAGERATSVAPSR